MNGFIIWLNRIGGIEDEEKNISYYFIAFDAADFNVSFIGSEDRGCFVIVVVNEGFDYKSGCAGIVGYLLMGDFYSV